MSTRSSLAFAIVASQYNLEYTQALVENAHREITTLEPGALVQLVWAPGSFEIPVIVKHIARKAAHDAILAFGVVFEGDTGHARLIAESVTGALQSIAVDSGIPVVHGVLLLDDGEQARERCMGEKKNRGIESARAAVSVARTTRELQQKG